MDTSNSANVSLTDVEESRVKGKSARSLQHSLSKAMAEALYQPHTLMQPKPLASRVKDAGKDFLRHNQTCQWIQFIQEPREPLVSKRETRQQPKVTPELEVVSVVKEPETPNVPEEEIPPHVELVSPSYEEQLRILQKQQEELTEQQHRLEEQLEQQMKSRQIISHPEPQSTTPNLSEVYGHKEVPTTTVLAKPALEEKDRPGCPPSRFRRRLKGCIAQSFAERDEGSIGSLLYNTKTLEPPTDRKSCSSTTSYGNYQRTAHEGRQYALSQESGSSISQVLSHFPYSSSFDVIKNSSETSATITETVTLDLTSKDGKKDGRRMF